MRSALSALRVGFNIMTLTSRRRDLPKEAAEAVGRVSTALERHFRNVRTGTPDDHSLREIDDAVELLLARPVPQAEDLLTALVAISSALHRHTDLFGQARTSLLPHALRRDLPA
jgi:hypothetical protein